MYCRSCGKEMADNAAICMNCGVPVGKGNKYCPRCGEETNPEAVMCVRCGGGLVWHDPNAVPQGTKSAIAAGLLGIFLGSLGVHNFYLGFKKKAVAQLLLSIAGIFFTVLYGITLAGAIIGGDMLLPLLAVLFLLAGIACMMASSIWALVEGIMLLCGAKKTDGKGNPLKD